MLIPRPVAGFVLVALTLMQIANFTLPLIPGLGYHTDPTLTGGFMTGVGLLGVLTVRKNRDDSDDDDDPPHHGGHHRAP